MDVDSSVKTPISNVLHESLSRMAIPGALAAAIALLLILQTLYWPRVIDDVFISLTYARNLGDGFGLVHNQGLKVEGFSNLLWILLLAPFRSIGLDLLISAKVVGVVLSVGTLILIPSLIKKIISDRRRVKTITVIALFLLAISPSYAFWGVVGLETPLFTFLVVLGFVLLLEGVQSGRRIISSALVFVALAMTRPEGLVFFASGIIWLVLWNRFGNGSVPPTLKWIARWCLIVIASVLMVTLFRLTYYGQFFPNTVYTKAGGDLIRQILRGSQYLLNFTGFAGYMALVLTLILGMRQAFRNWPYGMIVFATIVYFVFIICSGGDWMPNFRFFVPILPFLIVIFVTETSSLLIAPSQISEDKGAGYRDLLALLTVSGFMILIGGMTNFSLLKVEGLGLGVVGELVPWLEYVKANSRSGDTVAVVDAGRVGYETELRVLDMVGLLDKHVAHIDPVFPESPLDPAFKYLYGKWDTDYILENRPTFVQVHLDKNQYLTNGLFVTDWLGSDYLVNDPRFQQMYALTNLENGPIFTLREEYRK